MKENVTLVEEVLAAKEAADQARKEYERAHEAMTEARSRMGQTASQLRSAVANLGNALPGVRVVGYKGKLYYLNPDAADPIFSESTLVFVNDALPPEAVR